MSPPARRIPAVLHSSFWIVAYTAEIIAACFDLFDITLADAVEAELRELWQSSPAPDPVPSPHSANHEAIFNQVSSLFQRVQLSPSSSGAADTDGKIVELAKSMGAVLLAHETSVAQSARNLGVDVISIPTVILFLCLYDIIGKVSALTKLSRIESTTSREFVAEARRALETRS